MKKGIIIRSAYILILCLAVSTVAFTSSTEVYEDYYQGIFEAIDMMYYRSLGIDNITSYALNGAMENLNEYSCFVLNDTEESINSNAGIFLEKVRSGLRVVSVLPDSSASRAGMKAGDTITLIDKRSTAVMSPEAFNSYIVGNGSALIVYTDGETGVSRSVTLESDTTSGRDVEFVYLDGTGYIRVNRFSELSTERVSRILESMEVLGNTRVILDLRSLYTMNIEDACNLADLLVPQGTIARSGEKTYNASTKKVNFEVAVLIDDKTTGAAEAVAMAVHGKVYGQSSSGNAVFTKKYPVFSEVSYKYYSDLSGQTNLNSIFNFLKARDIDIEPSDITGYLNIVESGIYGSNNQRISDKNRVEPDVYISNTDMGYLKYTPGSFMIDIERDYSIGSVNYDIFIAKKILGFLGLFNGEYTVVYDEEFASAVNNYKSIMGFPEDGILDMSTQSSLNTYSMKTAVNNDDCVREALLGFDN
ncbi:MAG: hypothetical protein JXN10_00535 [Clostridia bacterium]|nr:hypothetical protein [Clostridia bacterium]MBN2881984.1 hypothetical protein [Clostridia bacterium]